MAATTAPTSGRPTLTAEWSPARRGRRAPPTAGIQPVTLDALAADQWRALPPWA